MSTNKWIQKAINPENKGKLREKLGIPEGKKISEKELNKALHGKNPTVRKEAQLAETLKGFHKR